MIFVEQISGTKAKVDSAVESLFQGDLNKTRALHLENLKLDLTDEDRLRTLLGLHAVEWSAGNIHLAVDYMRQAKELGAKSNPSFRTLATLHNNHGLLLRRLAESADNKHDYLDQAIIEYTASGVYYEMDGDVKLQAAVENNLAYLQMTLKRFDAALQHAHKAKDLTESVNDLTQLSYIYDTLAQIKLEMGELGDALLLIKRAMDVIEASDVLVSRFDIDATHARILFKLGNVLEGNKVLRKAIETAKPLGHTKAVVKLMLLLLEEGEAALLPTETIYYYQEAYSLASEKDKVTLSIVAYKLFAMLSPPGEKSNTDKIHVRMEKESVKRALDNSGGSITHAATSLDFHYQRLQHLLTRTYIDLARMRTPSKSRKKSIINKPLVKK